MWWNVLQVGMLHFIMLIVQVYVFQQTFLPCILETYLKIISLLFHFVWQCRPSHSAGILSGKASLSVVIAGVSHLMSEQELQSSVVPYSLIP